VMLASASQAVKSGIYRKSIVPVFQMTIFKLV
jgi:hypothetical protein